MDRRSLGWNNIKKIENDKKIFTWLGERSARNMLGLISI